jgi:hypothetical protein
VLCSDCLALQCLLDELLTEYALDCTDQYTKIVPPMPSAIKHLLPFPTEPPSLPTIGFPRWSGSGSPISSGPAIFQYKRARMLLAARFRSKPHPVQARRQRYRLVDIQENLTNGLARATACETRLIEPWRILPAAPRKNGRPFRPVLCSASGVCEWVWSNAPRTSSNL